MFITIAPSHLKNSNALIAARSLVCGCVVFALLALASLIFAREAGRVAAIWPANGFLLALVLLRPNAERRGLIAGGLIGNIIATTAMGDTLPVSVGLSFANTLEISIIAWAMRDVDLRKAMIHWPTVARFVAVGGVVGPAVSGAVACLTLAIWHHEPFGVNVVLWFVADALGMLVVAPPLLLMATPGAWPSEASLTKRLALAGILLGTLAIVFLQTRFPLLFLIPPVLVLIAFRCGAGAAAVALLITASASLAAVAAGLGPMALVDGGLDLRATIQQVFLAALVFTILPVSAVLMERAHSEARYRLLAETATDLVARFDPRGRFLYVSPSVRNVLGREPETMLGKDCTGIIPEEDLAVVRDTLKAYVALGPGALPPRYEYRAFKLDGTVVWLEATPRAIFDTKGHLIEFHDCVRDVTDRKALEQQLIDARDVAEDAARAKSDFLANMSHELRTPLTSVIGFSGLLENSQTLPDKERRFATRIGTASHALLGVINDILDYSKLEAGAVDLDLQPFNPAELGRSAASIVEMQCEAKGLALSLVAGERLPDCLMGDEGRLRQVVLNFLSNAVKFTASGEIELAIDWTGERMRVAVTDSGIGIPAEKIDALFERFTQADASTTRVYGGTGLGLAISRRLIEQMGGKIGATSQQGKGSTFWFEVPLPVADERRLSDDTNHEGLRPGLRVLLAEDAAPNRELVRLIVEAWGVHLDAVENGAEAVQAAASGDYDLILMDVQMPVMNGLDATARIRSLGGKRARTPILALSANVQPDHIEACRQAGMNGHIAKPIQLAELLSGIERAVDRRAVALDEMA